MQVSINNNQPAFGAKIVFMDKGKCFSLRQKHQLKTLADRIGDSADRFYVGTRKYDNISAYDYQTHFLRKDMQVLSTVNGVNHDYRWMHREVQDEIEQETSKYFYDLPKKERWKRFDKKLFEGLREFLETFNETVSGVSSRRGGETRKETRKMFRKEVSEFSKLKRTHPRMTFKQWVNNLLFHDQSVIPHLDQYKAPRTFAKPKTEMKSITPPIDPSELGPSDRIPIGQAIYEEFIKPAKDIIVDRLRVD